MVIGGDSATGAALVDDPNPNNEHGKVLRFNSPGHAAWTPGPVVDGKGSFTITAWVRASSADKTGPIVAQGTPGTASTAARDSAWLGLSRRATATDPMYWKFVRNSIDSSEQWSTGSLNDVETTDFPTDWTHVAAVYDSADRSMKLYVNGTIQRSASAVVGWHAQQPLYLGAELPGMGRKPPFEGYLDDVCLYSGVMNSSQLNLQWTRFDADPSEEGRC
jgi:hypothetical protein